MFWAGFAAFGWGSIITNCLSNIAMNGFSRFQMRFFPKYAPNLVDDLLDRIVLALHPGVANQKFSLHDNWEIVNVPYPDFNVQSFHAIGHSIACLAFASLGGLLAQGLLRRAEPSGVDPPDKPSA